MGLFTKYCAVCGRKIEGGNDFVRFGKHINSEEHAEQCAKAIEAGKQMAQEEPCSGAGSLCY